jgi:Cu/Ag efflux protein CusF
MEKTPAEVEPNRGLLQHRSFTLGGMAFRVRDPAMLQTVKPGDHIRFVPDRVNGQFTVTRIEKAR